MADSKRMDFSRYPRVEVKKDDALFVEDETTQDLYVLLSGVLGVYRDEVLVATIDEPLAIVGEMSALTLKPRTATVRALHQAVLVRVSNTDELFSTYPQMASKLARLLATRLHSMNERFVKAKSALAKLEIERAHDGLPAEVSADSLRVADVVRAVSEAAATPATNLLDVDESTLDVLNDILDWDSGLT